MKQGNQVFTLHLKQMAFASAKAICFTSRHDSAKQNHKQYPEEVQNKFPMEFILNFF
jgi:hypothetical protein